MNFPGLIELCDMLDKTYPPHTVLAEYHEDDGTRTRWSTDKDGRLVISSVTPCSFPFWRDGGDVAPDLQHSTHER